MAASITSMLLGYVPPIVITLLLGAHVSSYWFLATVVLMTAYAVTIKAKMILIMRWRTLSGIAGVTFLHRFHLYPESVWLMVSAFGIILGLIFLPWARR